MRLVNLTALFISILSCPAAARVFPAPYDTIATRHTVRGADCALFPAAARWPGWVAPIAQGQRFTPTRTQVRATEQALAEVRLLAINPGRKTGTDSAYARQISQRLGQYHRQYFGFYNQHRQPCLYLNLLLDTAFDGSDSGLHPPAAGYVPHWLRAPQQLADGGWQFWSVYYNLATRQFFGYWHDVGVGGG